MDDSDKDAPEASGSAGRAQMPIGGIYRDPREIKTNPTLTKFLRERMTAGVIGALVAIGILRPRTPSGDLGRRSWKGLSAFLGSIFAIIFVWTSVHIVQPGTVAVPVTFGHSGKPLSPGFHITLPFTTAYSINTRIQNYTMTSAAPVKGQKATTDPAVSVLGKDGGAASVSATVLYRVDPAKATAVFSHLGTNYSTAIVRSSANTCIRLVFTREDMVAAATTDWATVETGVATCMGASLKPQGLVLYAFQLREVQLSSDLQRAVAAKVAAQQLQEQQEFDLATARQKAEITRVQAQATADQKEILQCGATLEAVTLSGQVVQAVVPNPPSKCVPAQFSQADLQYAYIQALQAFAQSGGSSTVLLPGSGATPLISVPSPSGTVGTTPSTTPTSTP
jgi:regulator of protease activity HflC (stomatin/prohibitin superfamily)